MTEKSVWKYCYWFDEEQLSHLKKKMHSDGIEMTVAKQNPCEAFLGRIGYAEPHTWPAICKFDAAPWYAQSRFSGKIVVAASSRLDGYDELLETTVAPVDFTPPEMPSVQQKKALTGDAAFESCKPAQWDDFPQEMGEQIAQGLAKISGRPADTWDDLFASWTAVHANFVSPQYRAGDEFLNAPYSIGDSFNISSCCVQLFNLFDSKEKAFLVRPCTGATIVQALEKNQYYFVRLVKNQ